MIKCLLLLNDKETTTTICWRHFSVYSEFRPTKAKVDVDNEETVKEQSGADAEEVGEIRI